MNVSAGGGVRYANVGEKAGIVYKNVKPMKAFKKMPIFSPVSAELWRRGGDLQGQPRRDVFYTFPEQASNNEDTYLTKI